ncbi:MAG: hypothetical protein PHP75_00685 [Methylacidiphilaceae bacterium]|nr:hypothetical protein [Candidatus Methylacidiphilaceae bacterium]
MKPPLFSALLLILSAIPSHAIMTQWVPEKKPYQHGPLGTGEYSMVWNMRRYKTPPKRPYVIIGRIYATGGHYGTARTRAVTEARKHGADAILWATADIHGEAIWANGFWSPCEFLAIQWTTPPR